ncbi:MAG: class I mannose-6-phosphate isomerase [Tenacibaculum sp.]|nr:class I mannose-6-phosphate isomerase [Tenacibaculum sp.]
MKKINQFLKFNPILKEKIWGGKKLIQQLGKKSDRDDIGESWEISDVGEDISIVEKGDLKGKTLRSLVSEYKHNLVGNKVYDRFGDKFPLLIKFIDAKENLSLQVHPDDILAKKRHNSLGKTEMWYVLNSDEKGNIIIGFSEQTNKQTFSEYFKKGEVLKQLNIDNVSKGDVYMVPAGRIHAIGAGVLLAEVQETSDITYRLFDWNRKDKNGKSRELHVDLALNSIDYSVKPTYKEDYARKKDVPTNIVNCKYFTTNSLHLIHNYKANHTKKDSFIIYMCVGGQADFCIEDNKESLKIGQTLLVPASLKEFEIQPNKEVELLEVYIE